MVAKSTLQYATQLTGSQFKAILQIKSGCVNLKSRPHLRNTQNGNINCRLCHTSIESIGHVLGECKELHGMIVKRHDDVVNTLHSYLTSLPNTTTTKEVPIIVNGTSLKPDIIHLNHKSNQITIIDPTIRIENSMESREEQIIEKILKYHVLRTHLASTYNICENMSLMAGSTWHHS